MGCLPLSGGCERKLIDPFIAYLNERERASYAHVSCPDQEIRDRPQPDGLYANPGLIQRLAIERKTLTWPEDDVERHKAEHFLMERILDGLSSLTSDAPYELALQRISSIDHEELKVFAGEIVDIVKPHIGKLEPGCGIACGDGPWSYRFVLQEAEERDYWEPSKGLIISLPIVASLEIADPTRLPSVLDAKIKQHFLACERKFQEYKDDRNILLVDPHGSLRRFDGWWWGKMFSRYSVPSAISEIWLAVFDRVTDFEDGWMFTKVFPEVNSEGGG